MIASMLLRAAARRWPPELRDELLREWTAELHAGSGGWQRLRYAGSLATARPHRLPTVAPRLVTSLGSVATVSVALIALPAVYLYSSTLFRGFGLGSGDVGRYWGEGLASLALAALVGAICAWTCRGTTRLIKPGWLPVWIFGTVYVVVMALWLIVEGEVPRVFLIDFSCWLAAAVVAGSVAVRLSRGRSGWWSSSLLVLVGTVLAYWMTNIHGRLFWPSYGFELFVGSVPAAVAFVAVISPLLHVTFFAFVLLQQLARRSRTA